MANLRAKYRNRVVDESSPPVSVPPAPDTVTPKADNPQPAEQTEQSNPVEEAAHSAMKQRLAEMEAAERAHRQSQQEMPSHVTAWLNEHPRYLNDAVGRAELQLATVKAVRDGKTWIDSGFLQALEHHLGLQQETVATPDDIPPRNVQASRPQSAAPVSAPPTRESLSWSSGRPAGDGRVTLTPQELELARTIGITPEAYAEGKRRMLREKQGGLHDER